MGSCAPTHCSAGASCCAQRTCGAPRPPPLPAPAPLPGPSPRRRASCACCLPRGWAGPCWRAARLPHLHPQPCHKVRGAAHVQHAPSPLCARDTHPTASPAQPSPSAAAPAPARPAGGCTLASLEPPAAAPAGAPALLAAAVSPGVSDRDAARPAQQGAAPGVGAPPPPAFAPLWPPLCVRPRAFPPPFRSSLPQHTAPPSNRLRSWLPACCFAARESPRHTQWTGPWPRPVVPPT
jgi:hypothetical protein